MISKKREASRCAGYGKTNGIIELSFAAFAEHKQGALSKLCLCVQDNYFCDEGGEV
jgi:hypothetical protein